LGQQRLRDIRGGVSVPRIVFFGPAAPLRYSRRGFGPSNCFLRASSAFEIFETGFRSLELFSSGQQRLRGIRGGASVPRNVFSGQQCLQATRGRASVPRIVFFGSAMHSKCSSLNCEPSNHPFRASNAVILFGYRRLNPRNASLSH
jgi:hypothetical protein